MADDRIIISSLAVRRHTELYDDTSAALRLESEQEVRLSGKSWKYVSAQQSSDPSELHSGNKHFKSSLLVVWPTDLTQHEFRLFTRRHCDVVMC